MFRLVPVDTLTGDPIVPHISASAVSYERTMWQGRGEFTINTNGMPDALVQRLAKGWSTTLVPEWVQVQSDGREGGIAEYAGIVTGVRGWNGRNLTVTTHELPIITTKRHLFGMNDGPVTWQLKRATRAEIVSSALWLALSGGKGGRWQLPVIWPEMTTGDVVRTFDWWRFKTAADIVTEITAEDPDLMVDFNPVWTDGRLKWRMQAGTIKAGELRLPVSTEAYPIPGGAVVDTDWDYLNQITGHFTIGDGEKNRTPYGRATSGMVDVDPEIPWLDTSSAWVGLDSTTRLNYVARTKLREQRYGLRTDKVVIDAKDPLTPSMVRPGTRLVLDFPGDALRPAGEKELLVLAKKRDETTRVELTVMEA